MGIGKSAYHLLLEEKKKGNLSGDSLLQLGRQCVLFDYATLLKYAQKHGVELTPVTPQLSFDSHYRTLGFIDDITLFKALGFKRIHSLDYSDFEGADITWDLNLPLPEQYHGKFDIIYDGGTAEHVFHFPQFLTNVHHLLKTNGTIIHVSPSNNHVDHGFYMFSPQVYFEYYTANRYEILTSQVFAYTTNYKKTWSIYTYQPGLLDNQLFGFGGKLMAIHLMARKTPEAVSGVIPQQGTYLHAWKKSHSVAAKRKIDPLTRLGISLKKKVMKRLSYKTRAYLQRRKLHKFAEY